MEYFYNFDKLSYVCADRPEECILCCVCKNDPKVPNLSVFQSNYWVVSLNLYPYNPGHLLIFPKTHIVDYRNLSKLEQLELNEMIEKALTVLDQEMGSKAYNIGCNMGLVAGASIDHLHWHIIPRYPGEIGIIELIAGKRVLVEHPLDTRQRLITAFKNLYGE